MVSWQKIQKGTQLMVTDVTRKKLNRVQIIHGQQISFFESFLKEWIVSVKEIPKKKNLRHENCLWHSF